MKRLLHTMILASPLFLRIFFSEAAGQTTIPSTPFLQENRTNTTAGQIPSNSVSHLAVRNTSIWIGTGKGLALSTNGGRSFQSFRYVPQFARPGIFSLNTHGDTIWCSTGYSKETDGGSVQTGTGYTFSFDNGATWRSVPQPLDGMNDSLVSYGSNTVRFIPIIVPEQNVTFDLAVGDSSVWVASWSSGLRKTTDNGQTWKRIVLPNKNRNTIAPADSLGSYLMDPRLDYNFLVFSVYPEDKRTLWAGSAGGVNRSTDGGASWTKFTVDNQSQPIAANWVIAIKGQRFGSRSRIWTTNWPTDNPIERYGVSCTDDSGKTWQRFLAGVKAYDFAFKDSIVYIATDEGLYRSADGGNSWVRSGSVVDPASGNILTSQTFYAVGVIGDTVFAGNADGFVRSIDNAAHPFGETWEVIRASEKLSTPSTTYAYPNPFSPRQQPVRIHYSTGGTEAAVTIEVFDFGMNRLRTVIRDAQREGTREHDDLWDGRDDGGTLLPNGVYFYRVTIGSGEPAWGKVLVIQ